MIARQELLIDKAVHARLSSLLERRKPGFGLERDCYLDPDLYRLELELIWRGGWLFVGFSCEIEEPGNYLTYEVGDDPVVVVRQQDGSIRGFHNVCRHRGSIVVLDERGKRSRFICPYHGWIYDLDGALLQHRGVAEVENTLQYGLRVIHAAEAAGMIFISLATEPPDFTHAQEALTESANPQGFDGAKVAGRIDFEIATNWKLVWENNRECLHCDANHPQYVQANFDRYDVSDLRQKSDFEAERERVERGLLAAGIGGELFDEFGLFGFPDPMGSTWWSVNRTVLRDGFATESVDGQLVSTLMGDYVEPDVGTLRVRMLPNFWCHASCDHAVSTRLRPAGIDKTIASVTWLVDKAALEGRDYELEQLMPFWELTSEQDWQICERQQRGISSSAYLPGPLSSTREANVDSWLTWYTQSLLSALSVTSP